MRVSQHGERAERREVSFSFGGARAREGERERCKGGGVLSFLLPAPASEPTAPFPPFPSRRPPYVLSGTSAARPIRELGGGRAAPKLHSACIPSDWELTGCFANRLRAARRGGDARERERERKKETLACVSVCFCANQCECVCV